MRSCKTCGDEIPPARLEALPNTRTCVKCSDVEPVAGHVYWDGKHTPILQVMSKQKTEEFAKKDRRGFHANVPAASPNNPFERNAVANRDLSLDIANVKPYESQGIPANAIMAKCHPDRRAVTGKSRLCQECAVNWYKNPRDRTKRF
jgi:hypothetical protein